ncbi:hypothetical protein [Pseudonocardia sp. GCM10023141]
MGRADPRRRRAGLRLLEEVGLEGSILRRLDLVVAGMSAALAV